MPDWNRLHLPADVTIKDLGDSCALLRVERDEPFRDARSGPFAIAGLGRFMALSLHHHFVTSPSWGSDLAAVPARCQFVLWEGEGACGALVPLLDGDFRSELAGTDGGLSIVTECGPQGRPQSAVSGVLVCVRTDPYQAAADAMAAAVAWMGRGRLRTDKPVPDWVELLGWCTYDAFYGAVDEANILAGLAEFGTNGWTPGHLLIDGGWQDEAKGFLQSYDTKEGFTDRRLATVTRRAKREHGVREVGCWQTLFGTIRGVSPDAPAFEPLGRHGVIETGTEKDVFGVVDIEDVSRFFYEYHSRMDTDGIDYIKVDFQSALRLMTHDRIGRAEGARRWQNAIQASVARHFAGRMLNCMAMGSDEVYHTPWSNVCRSSDDYYPKDDKAHAKHLRLNAFNSLWLGALQVCDWDMFQSGHPWGRYHALARAVSGGPVYVSDVPGTSDYALLQSFLAADGRTLRCPHPALPVRESLFRDHDEPILLKVFNRAGTLGLLGVFHPGVKAEEPQRTEDVGAWMVEGLEGERFAAWSVTRGLLGVVEREQRLPVTLDTRGGDVIVFSPVTAGFAPLGLVDKINPAASVLATYAGADGRSLRVDLRGGGRGGVWSDGPVTEVCLDGALVAFEQTDGLVTFDTGGRPRCRVDIQR